MADAYTWIGGAVVTLWTLAGWAMAGYGIYFYIIHQSCDILPDICSSPMKMWLIITHIVGAIIILTIGPFQVLNHVWRIRIHRWTGVLYVFGCNLASLAGLTFIMIGGTVGGVWMDIAFSISGSLTLTFPLIAAYFAVEGHHRAHKAWAIRAYTIASSSVFYRVLYFGVYPIIYYIWGPLHAKDFQNPLDNVFSFLYFLLMMGIAELYLLIRYRGCICCPAIEKVKPMEAEHLIA